MEPPPYSPLWQLADLAMSHCMQWPHHFTFASDGPDLSSLRMFYRNHSRYRPTATGGLISGVAFMRGSTVIHCKPSHAVISAFLQTPVFLPYISDVVGNHLPERYISRLAVGLISFPTLMDGVVYHNFFSSRSTLCLQKKWYQWLNRFHSFLWMTRLFLFYTFTLISSQENEGKLITDTKS